MAETNNDISGSVFGTVVQAGHIDHVSFGPHFQQVRAGAAGLRRRLDVAKDHEVYLVDRLNDTDKIYVVLTLVPDVYGDIKIDNDAVRAFRAGMVGHDPLIVHRGSLWRRTLVGGTDWLLADSAHDDARMLRRLACALHRSGAGSMAVPVKLLRFDEPAAKVVDQQVVDAVISGLVFLAQHARDRAAAAGNASLRATITPVTRDAPAIPTSVAAARLKRPARSRAVTEPPVATAVADLDDLTQFGPALLRAARVLTTGLVQKFRHPETPQITRDGHLQLQHWHHDCHPRLREWAANVGIRCLPTTSLSGGRPNI